MSESVNVCVGGGGCEGLSLGSLTKEESPSLNLGF